MLTMPASAIAHCRDLTRFHSQTFYFGSCFLPKAKRTAVWAIYAVCRMGDDIVDENANGNGISKNQGEQLAEWWNLISAAYAGKDALDDPLWCAFAWVIQRYQVPKEAFFELYQGLQMDLAGYVYRDMADLELYCRRVAGVVGLMIAPIVGFQGGEKALRSAVKLGQAMQLTNILRDVGEDIMRDRLYIPQSVLALYGISEQEIRSRKVSVQYQVLVRHLIALARSWYAEGREGLSYLHGSSRFAIGIAAAAYEGILDSLEKNKFDNFQYRAQVSRTKKLLLLPKVYRQLWSSYSA